MYRYTKTTPSMRSLSLSVIIPIAVSGICSVPSLAPICLITRGMMGQLFRAVVLETVSAIEVSFSVICGMVDVLQDCELVS